MNADYSITANFAINQHDLTVGSSVGGSVTDPGEGTFTYDHGTEVDLVADADADYHFVEWTGDTGTIADTTSATTTITIEGDYSIQANFEEDADLMPVTGLEVLKDEAAGDVILEWDDVGAPEYNVYHSTDEQADFGTWTELGTVSTETFTHTGGLGGSNYYIVRATDGTEEGENSTMGFCYEMSLTYDADARLHYVSIPGGFNNMEPGTITAEDIVEHIEGGTGDTDEFINAVVKWDYTERAFDEVYSHSIFGWDGDNFDIEPGAAVGLQLTSNLDWHVNGRDSEEMISLIHDPDARLNYINIPYTAEGIETAEDLVEAIEGGTGDTDEFINAVVKWDYTERAFDEVYSHSIFGWDGDNFDIEPGAAVGLQLTGDLDWMPELVTPVQES